VDWHDATGVLKTEQLNSSYCHQDGSQRRWECYTYASFLFVNWRKIMRDCKQFYINGQWVDPVTPNTLDVINPANEEVCAQISLGSEADVDLAVAAAKQAFVTFLQEAAKILKTFAFEETIGNHRVFKEPIGVCGLITPWNWPVNQISCKVAPALAVGCTVVLKPSEVAPLSAYLFAQVMHEAGVPAGVFNMVNGDGPGVGTALSKHPGVDMMSFTGSTRAGTLVAQNAAPTVKRVTQELGGKSPNIILDDADLEKAVTGGLMHMYQNTGQSCNAPSRMLVPAAKLAEA
jgi:aldehyde dehydrogenase (NAD+)